MNNPPTINRAPGVNPYTECVNASIGELFDPPFVETAIDRVYRDIISPSVQIVPSSTEINFNVLPSEDYTSLRDTLIFIKLKLTTLAGGPLPVFSANVSVGLENFVTTSLFSNIRHECCGELASGELKRVRRINDGQTDQQTDRQTDRQTHQPTQ